MSPTTTQSPMATETRSGVAIFPGVTASRAERPLMKANEEPRYAGSVPTPEVKSVTEVSSPTRNGTSTVAPNMANRCWSESGSDWRSGSRSWTSTVRARRRGLPSGDDEVDEEGRRRGVHERTDLARAAGEELQDDVRDEPGADAVRDAVGEGHHREHEERGDGLRRVGPG